MRDLEAALQAKRDQFRYRVRRVLQSAQGVTPVIDGQSFVSFCSNDYLGLASHPSLAQAMVNAANTYGSGSGAAHLLTGHSAEHHALEQELAAFCGRERALLFSTGYMANLGVMQALLEPGDTVYQDRLNHASLLDGGRLSGARLSRYPHADSMQLDKKLADSKSEHTLVATDGVFSMDGDMAPLDDLAQVCQQHDSWLMVDDAHGIGVLGKTGRGSLEVAGLDQDQVPVLMGTLGKALGCFGAFVAGSETLIETLIQQARAYIFTTAPPPAVAAAARAALKLVDQEAWRREALFARVAQFRNGMLQLGHELLPSDSAIQAWVLGEDRNAVAVADALQAAGQLVMPVRPPTVPEGTSRLRFTFSADHTEQQVERLLQLVEQVGASR